MQILFRESHHMVYGLRFWHLRYGTVDADVSLSLSLSHSRATNNYSSISLLVQSFTPHIFVSYTHTRITSVLAILSSKIQDLGSVVVYKDASASVDLARIIQETGHGHIRRFDQHRGANDLVIYLNVFMQAPRVPTYTRTYLYTHTHTHTHPVEGKTIRVNYCHN